jgi:hypothetical protein
MKAININTFLDFKEEMIAIQAGRYSIIKVFNRVQYQLHKNKDCRS